jgi:glycogen debranching enzyme
MRQNYTDLFFNSANPLDQCCPCSMIKLPSGDRHKMSAAMSPRIILLIQFIALLSSPAAMAVDIPHSLLSLGITIENPGRQFCFTNKEAGTYYGEATARNGGGWRGWFVNTQKILHDCGVAIDRSRAVATVYPHQLVRQYPDGTIETFTLLDSLDAILLEVVAGTDTRIPLIFEPTQDFSLRPVTTQRAYFVGRTKTPARGFTPSWIGISSEQALTGDGKIFLDAVKGKKCRIVIAAGGSVLATQHTIDFVERSADSLIAKRALRMERVLSSSYFRSDNERLNAALMWAKLSVDALIMNQSVDGGAPTKGIFAGLPWFNNYWGRDSFISLPGATYVTGNFSDAREILLSFPKFQEADSTNPNWGRIPNLATPTSVSYNTADGTPRFVSALLEYVQYSGDTCILRTLYPVVERSIRGTLRYHTDSLSFLTHGDAESWMDAVGTNGPWSPRGNRANDVQALWYRQLTAGAAIAKFNHDAMSVQSWEAVAAKVRRNFQNNFLDPESGLIFDHLLASGKASREIRPNQLFCLDLLPSRAAQERVVRAVSSALAYEHGVGTLSQQDSNFHPYHHFEPAYVQDAAYHTGIVWTWLNGEATNAMARFGSCESAGRITFNMVHQILDRGCAGTLSELLDAYPRAGESEPRLSGTFSQAWSLAEFVRSIYQGYLGVTVDALNETVTLAPVLPREFGNVEFDVRMGSTAVRVRYRVKGDSLVVTASSGNRSFRSTLTTIENRAAVRLYFHTSFAAGQSDTALRLTIPHTTGSSRPMQLASPIAGLDIPSLRGPSYPILTLAQVRQSNPKAKVLFDKQDPVGDDTGVTGTYVYPTNVNFVPGILDLTRASIRYDDQNVYFSLRFRALSNPGWHPEYGFQLTFAAIAINRGGKEGAKSIGLNSHFVLQDRFAFDRLIAVGGGLRVTDEKGAILCEYLPQAEDSANPIGNTPERSIEFSIPIEYLGVPRNQWKITILTGAQDDHGGAGIGEFRTIDSIAGEWIGGGKKNPGQPNAYDILQMKK